MDNNMEDDDDFNLYPGGKSRLSHLFSTLVNDSGDVNQSLTFVPPKQPKKSDTQTSDTPERVHLSLIHVIEAYTYKLEKGEYVNKGPLGVSILGNITKKDYKLLLYKGKNVPVCYASINHLFKFTIEPNNYAKFQSDSSDDWSIAFNSENELIDFTKQIVLAKYNSMDKSPVSVLLQDLVAGEGYAADVGDAVAVSFTGKLYKNHTFGEVFYVSKESKKSTVLLGKSNIPKCWTEGLMGAKKNMKRILFMVAAFSSDFVPLPEFITPEDVLIFEITIHKIKRSHNQTRSPSTSSNRSEKKPEIPPRTHSVSNDGVRSRGASLSEQLNQSPRKESAQIISRLAKIGGMSLLPQIPIHTQQTSSESEPEKEIDQEHSKSRKQSSASPKHSVLNKIEPGEFTAPQTQMSMTSVGSSMPLSHGSSFSHTPPLTSGESVHYFHPPYLTPHQHMVPTMMPQVISPSASYLDNQFPLLIAETRAQNTELRFNVNKITDKIDSAISKIDDVKKYQQENLRTREQVPYMEGDILVQNIERIVQENIKLKQEIELKNSKIQELNEKLCDSILQRNQRLVEESNSILENRNDNLLSSYQNQIQILEQGKIKLISELKEVKSHADVIEVQLEAAQNQVKCLEDKLEASEKSTLEREQSDDSLLAEKKKSEELIQELQNNLQHATIKTDDLHSELKLAKENLTKAEKTNIELKAQMVELSKTAEYIKSLEDKLQNVAEFEQKHKTLLDNSIQMKKSYEVQIKRLAGELKNRSLSSSESKFPDELKKSMNKLYTFLKNEIDVKGKYSGADILDLCLNVIKRTTFAILGQGQIKNGATSLKDGSLSEKTVNVEKTSEKGINESSQLDDNIAKSNDGETVSNSSHLQSTGDNTYSKIKDPSENVEETEMPTESELLSAGDQPSKQIKEEPVKSCNTPGGIIQSATENLESATENLPPKVKKTSADETINEDVKVKSAEIPILVNDSPSTVQKEKLDAKISEESQEKSKSLTENEKPQARQPSPIEQQTGEKCDLNVTAGDGIYNVKTMVLTFALFCFLLLCIGALFDEMETSSVASTTI